MDTILVIMQKNKESGFLEKELASLSLDKNEELIVNIFAIEEDKLMLHLKLSTDRDVEDWEYSAIYDYYDCEVFGDKIISISEDNDSYNPEWEIVIEYKDEISKLEDEIVKILEIHRKELNDVYEAIKDKKGEYSQDEK